QKKSQGAVSFLRSCPWIQQDAVYGADRIGREGDTALVHPKKLCNFFLSECTKAGNVKVITGARVLSVQSSHVVYLDANTSQEVQLPFDKCLITAGPWTASLVGDRLTPTITHKRAHSITVMGSLAPRIALFTEITLQNGACVEPELYPRQDHLYVSGDGYSRSAKKTLPLPESVDQIEVDDQTCLELKEIVDQTVPGLSALEIEKKQACYLPYSSTNRPILGKIKDNLFVAAGHGVWGILLAPATGKVMADLLQFGASQDGIDLGPFAP
ncbi:hypothetical protein HDU91_004647, partial [Kappamyces sp. JEL0680]